MAGLHVHLRAVTLAVAIGVPLADGCSCSERPLGDDPELLTKPACLWLISPRGTRADGTHPIIDAEEHHRAATVCICLTQAEYDSLGDRLERVALPEEGTLLEEFNELAYDECTRRAALIDGLIDDECLDYYQNGTWLKDIYVSEGAWANATPPGFSCEG